MPADMQDELRKLIERHCLTIAGEVEEIAQSLAKLQEGGPLACCLDRVIEGAHRLKGSSGSIGFAEVSAAATALDVRLKDQRSLAKAGARLELEAVMTAFDHLQHISARIKPQDSLLFDTDMSRLF